MYCGEIRDRAMKTFRIALALMLVLVVAAFGVASAQTGLTTNYTTSITYQNVSTQNAVVTMRRPPAL
jgi:hypothetical protein